MQKGSLAFEFLTQNSSEAYFYFLDFQTPRKVRIKGIKVEYAVFMNCAYLDVLLI